MGNINSPRQICVKTTNESEAEVTSISQTPRHKKNNTGTIICMSTWWHTAREIGIAGRDAWNLANPVANPAEQAVGLIRDYAEDRATEWLANKFSHRVEVPSPRRREARRYRGTMPMRKRTASSVFNGPVWKRRNRVSRYRGRSIPGRYRGYLRTGGYYGRYNRTRGFIQETKFVDINGTLSASQNGTVLQLATIGQGTGQSERIGRKITLKSLGLHLDLNKGALHSASDPASVANHMGDRGRIMIVIDTQTNGAVFSPSDLLQPIGAPAAVDIDSFRNLDQASRFKVLYDKWHDINSTSMMNSGGGYYTSSHKKTVNIYKKLATPMEYDDTINDGTITTIRTNNIYLVWITDKPNALECQFACRIRFNG